MPRRMLRLRPVMSQKHVVDAEGSQVTTQSTVDLVEVVDNPTVAATNEVPVGSTVNSIYLRVEALHAAGAGRPNFYIYVMKNPGANLSLPQANSVGGSDEKRFIIHQEMVMLSGDAGNGLPRTIFAGVIRIPRGYKRFGIKDKLQLALRGGTSSMTYDFCVQCIYKNFK